MGAWGSGVFENDDACDWLGELVDEESIDFVIAALKLAARKKGYIEEPDGSNILAAAEVVAALAGKGNPDLPEEVLPWLEENSSALIPELLELARTAVRKVKENSELRELWEESEDLESWLAHIENLDNRL